MKYGDNPQGRLLGYVAGIIDGEGTISVYLRKKRKNNRLDGNNLVPFISIVNTDIRILQQVRKLFQLIGCSNNMIWRRRDKNPKGTKGIFQLRVCGAKGVKMVLEKLTWYLVAKRRQAKLTLKLCELMEERMRKYYEPHENRKRNEIEITEEELELGRKIRALNRYPRLPPETIR